MTLDELREGVRQLLVQGQTEDALALIRQAADRFASAGEDRGHLECCAAAATLLNSEGRAEEALPWLRREADLARLLAARILCKGLPDLGKQLSDLGRHEEALEPLREAAAAAQQLDDAVEQTEIFHTLAHTLGQTDRNTEALEWGERALEAARRCGDPKAVCRDLYWLGNYLGNLGRYSEAVGPLREAARQAEELDHPVLMCESFRFLAAHLDLRGSHAEALTWLRRAADQLPRVPDAGPALHCHVCRRLGSVLTNLGRYEEALTHLRQAADHADRLRDALVCCNTYCALGMGLLVLRRGDEAIDAFRTAAREAEQVQDSQTRGEAFAALGNGLNAMARMEEALPWLERAAQEAQRVDVPVTRCNALRAWGDALSRLRRHEEAFEKLRQADEQAQLSDNPVNQRNVAYTLGLAHVRARQWTEACARLREAQTHLLTALSRNQRADAVGNVTAIYHPLFEWAVGAVSKVWEDEGRQTDTLWHGLPFIDGAKCVTIREGLRRHGQRLAEPAAAGCWPTWAPGGFFMSAAPNPAEAGATRSVLRGLGSDSAGPVAASPVVLELPGEADAARNDFCQPIDRGGVARLLPDPDTVVVVFHFLAAHLMVLPLRLDEQGQPRLLHAEHGYFHVPDVLPQVEALAERARQQVRAVCRTLVSASRRDRETATLAGVCVDLYRLLQFDEVLDLIEPDRQRRARLHLVLIPDGPLYLLPLHALSPAEGEPCLYQSVASVRFALSLRTLELQQAIEEGRAGPEATDRILRGVAFANPDRKPVAVEGGTRMAYLPGVERETAILVEEAGAGRWWLHGDRGAAEQQASRENFRHRHGAGNVTWLMAHGGSVGTAFADLVELPQRGRVAVQEPALRLVDGPVSMSRLLAEGYDFSGCRLLHVSACLLGELTTLGASKEVMGYIAVLTLLGCRRVVSALWELADDAAAEFSRHWLRALLRRVFQGDTERSPHAFAIAFREALDSFRAACPQWRDEFFWAPYMLYGLG